MYRRFIITWKNDVDFGFTIYDFGFTISELLLCDVFFEILKKSLRYREISDSYRMREGRYAIVHFEETGKKS